jgi:HSP20 family protein
MADTDVQTTMNDAGHKAASAANRSADPAAQAAKKGADTLSDTAKAGVEAEQRTFAAAAGAGRQSAEAVGHAAKTSLKVGQEMARHGQDLARRASDQATDFWRSSLTPMTQLSGEMNRWFEQIWRRASPAAFQGGLPLAMLAPFTGHPLSDLRETAKGYELTVELPGLKPDDIDLSLRGDVLILSGEKAEENDGEQGTYRFSERRLGRFERVFALPPGADRAHIDASFQDGLLRIAIPYLPEGEQGRPIDIKG